MTKAWRPGDSCAIKGCSGLIQSVGFCSHHYDMWNRYGHPLAGVLWEHKARVRKTHDKERKAYSAMKTRCLNPNSPSYAAYGGRGIKICDRWLQSFENFFMDMRRAPAGTSLDRIDVNGNYEPGNCRWADARTQTRNRRATRLNGRTVAEARARYHAGEKPADLARHYDIPFFTMYQALTGKSWTDIEEAGHG